MEKHVTAASNGITFGADLSLALVLVIIMTAKKVKLYSAFISKGLASDCGTLVLSKMRRLSESF